MQPARHAACIRTQRWLTAHVPLLRDCRERCKVKAKQTVLCNSMGLFDIVPPRDEWLAILPNDCGFDFDHSALGQKFSQQYYVTPGPNCALTSIAACTQCVNRECLFERTRLYAVH